MKQRRGTLYLVACRQTVSDCASTPSLPSNTAIAPSRTRSERSTSTVKSTWRGGIPQNDRMVSCLHGPLELTMQGLGQRKPKIGSIFIVAPWVTLPCRREGRPRRCQALGGPEHYYDTAGVRFATNGDLCIDR